MKSISILPLTFLTLSSSLSAQCLMDDFGQPIEAVFDEAQQEQILSVPKISEAAQLELDEAFKSLRSRSSLHGAFETLSKVEKEFPGTLKNESAIKQIIYAIFHLTTTESDATRGLDLLDQLDESTRPPSAWRLMMKELVGGPSVAERHFDGHVFRAVQILERSKGRYRDFLIASIEDRKSIPQIDRNTLISAFGSFGSESDIPFLQHLIDERKSDRDQHSKLTAIVANRAIAEIKMASLKEAMELHDATLIAEKLPPVYALLDDKSFEKDLARHQYRQQVLESLLALENQNSKDGSLRQYEQNLLTKLKSSEWRAHQGPLIEILGSIQLQRLENGEQVDTAVFNHFEALRKKHAIMTIPASVVLNKLDDKMGLEKRRYATGMKNVYPFTENGLPPKK